MPMGAPQGPSRDWDEEREVVCRVLARLQQSLASSNVSTSRAAVAVLAAPHVVLNYVAPVPQTLRATAAAVFEASKAHWSVHVRERCEELFDALLDFAQ